jgi:hypothetical protein
VFSALQTKEYPVIIFQHAGDTDVRAGQITLSWEAIATKMSVHDVRQGKNGPCLAPVIMKPESEWVTTDSETASYRSDENVEALSMIVLDLDEPGAFEKAKSVFTENEYIYYSTHSYSAETPEKIRMVLKLDDPIPASDWPYMFNILASATGADPQCGNLLRHYHLPSHRPTEELMPLFGRNKGQSLTSEHVKKIKARLKNTLTAEEYDDLDPGKSRHKSKSNGYIRHYTGKLIPSHEARKQPVNYSYESLEQVFMMQIRQLQQDDSRHRFALSVVSSAVSQFGSQIDIHQVIQFLYKASDTHSTKSIANKAGNTRREIPGMVTSAMKKFAPGLMETMGFTPESLTPHVREIVGQVEKDFLQGVWHEKEVKKNKKNLKSDVTGSLYKNIDNSLDGWIERNRASITQFVQRSDVIELAENVMAAEYNKHGEDTSLNNMGQFVMYCVAAYGVKVKSLKGEDLDNFVESYKNQLLEKIDEVIPKAWANENDKIGTFTRSAVKIGWCISKQKDWRFTSNNPKNTPGAEPTGP